MPEPVEGEVMDLGPSDGTVERGPVRAREDALCPPWAGPIGHRRRPPVHRDLRRRPRLALQLDHATAEIDLAPTSLDEPARRIPVCKATTARRGSRGLRFVGMLGGLAAFVQQPRRLVLGEEARAPLRALSPSSRSGLPDSRKVLASGHAHQPSNHLSSRFTRAGLDQFLIFGDVVVSREPIVRDLRRSDSPSTASRTEGHEQLGR